MTAIAWDGKTLSVDSRTSNDYSLWEAGVSKKLIKFPNLIHGSIKIGWGAFAGEMKVIQMLIKLLSSATFDNPNASVDIVTRLESFAVPTDITGSISLGGLFLDTTGTCWRLDVKRETKNNIEYNTFKLSKVKGKFCYMGSGVKHIDFIKDNSKVTRSQDLVYAATKLDKSSGGEIWSVTSSSTVPVLYTGPSNTTKKTIIDIYVKLFS